MPRAARTTLALAMALSGLLTAARSRAEPAAPPPAGSEQCVPQCRSGYLCQQGRCVSMCNPPCPSGESCIDGVRCEAAPSDAREPPPPPLKPSSFAERSHSAIGFHLGFGGSSTIGGATSDLDATLGFNIREDIPVVRYLLIGPLFQFGAWRPDVPGASRNYYVDIDVYVRGRIPLELDPIGVELWGGIPIGLTLSFLGNDIGPALDSFGIGWDFGVLFGGAVHFTKTFGMFAEIGWLQHRMSHDYSQTRGDVSFRLSQGNFNIGFVFGS